MSMIWITIAVLAVACAILLVSIRRRTRTGATGFAASDRVLVEDTLKQIHEAEYRGHPATLRSLVGVLGVRADRAMRVLAIMETRGLVRSEGEAIRPTAAGRDYALQILRAHRLWESHLAVETGVAQVEWHADAERREHALTRAQTDAIAARLGHPRYDPHGDPIPTAAGDVPSPGAGIPLNTVAPGLPVLVVHVEDEPPAAYAQITKAGVYAGLELMVIEATPQRVVFLAEGEERSLAPVLAANVAVEKLADGERFDAKTRTEPLSRLQPGDSAEVLAVSRACRGLERRRLLDLGILPGTRIEAVMRSPSGDPTAYRVRGAMIALRRQQAEFIRVRRPVASPVS